MKSKVATAIERRIKAQNRSITSVERDGGLKRGVVWNLVNGKTQMPRHNTLELIARALGCRVEDIYADVVDGSAVPKQAAILAKRVQWDSNFYTEVVRKVNQLFAEEGINPPKSTVLDIVEEVYDFSYESKEIDQKLVRVLVQHEIRKQ